MGTFLLKTPNSAKNQMSDLVEQYRNIENLSSAYGLNVNLPPGYMDSLELQKQLKFSMRSAQPILNSSSFKIDDILNNSSTAASRKTETNNSSNNNHNNASLVKSETNSNSSSLSVSSYCSSVASSLPSPYQSTSKFQDSTGLPMHASNNPQNSTEFLLNHANSLFMSNPFMNIGNAQGLYNSQIENYNAFMDQLNQQNQQYNKFNLPFEYLKQHSLQVQPDHSSFQLNNDSHSSHRNTTEKLAMIDQLAKQIDNYTESGPANNNVEKKTGKDKFKGGDKQRDSKQLHKKSEKSAKRALKKYEEGHGCCGDTGCSSGMDQHQLPMCLRGTSEEQVHLASLFNTLIHHKKCRRTRTVFTDMQLIGLEKRFENQKYLSTPDRIQLADFLGLSQLQVKTWYQNRRMKWKKKVLKDGSKNAPTKPKGRPKKNSIPSFSDILKAAAAAENNSINESTASSSFNSSAGVKHSDMSSCSDEADDEEDMDLSDDDENEEIYDVEDSDEEDMSRTDFVKGSTVLT